MISMLGVWVQTVAAAWMMTSLTDSKQMVALIQSSIHLPMMAFSFLSGVIADSFDRRNVMLFAQAFGMIAAGSLFISAYTEILTPWSLLALSFLVGAGMAMHSPSWQSSIVDIIGNRESLPAAVGLNSMGTNVVRSIGPALGGFLVAAVGTAAAFLFNALTYVFVIAALLIWKSPQRKTKLPREPIVIAVNNGLRYVLMSPNIQRLQLRGFVFGMAAVSANALLPIIVRTELQQTATFFGFLLGCFGFGAVGAALLNPRLRQKFESETIVRMACVATGLALLAIALVPHPAVLSVAQLAAGASWVMALNLFNVTIQLSTPRWVVGRALSLYNTCTFAGMGLGAYIWGTIAAASSSSMALICAAGVVSIGALIGLFLPLPKYGVDNLEPLNRFKEPLIELDITPRSGPIVITLDYEVDQAKVEEFLSIMSERRRMHLRDGAYNWALMRDIENPQHWTERFCVPTWLEYVRHNERRTIADGELGSALRKLINGKPVIRRQVERQTVTSPEALPDEFH